MISKWKIISSVLVFNNKWFKVQQDVVKLPNGKLINDYFFWKEPNVSQIVAITNEDNIVLVKQYKHGIGDIMIECPAGYVDEEEGFEEATIRELTEETGYSAKSLEFIGQMTHDPTKSSGLVKLYLARNVEKTSTQKLDESEEIEILELPIKQVLNMIYDGKIWATGTIAAIFLALKKIGYKL